MKRFFCFLLVLVLLPVVSLADLPDLSGLSYDELLELSYLVQNMLFEQALPDGLLVPAGDYIVGADIPAGEFRADVVSDVGGYVQVYKSKADMESSPLSYITEIYLGNMWGTLVFRLVLEEGNYLKIWGNSLRLSTYYGLADFANPKK